jgi:hypothetical protein
MTAFAWRGGHDAPAALERPCSGEDSKVLIDAGAG